MMPNISLTGMVWELKNQSIYNKKNSQNTQQKYELNTKVIEIHNLNAMPTLKITYLHLKFTVILTSVNCNTITNIFHLAANCNSVTNYIFVFATINQLVYCFAIIVVQS